MERGGPDIDAIEQACLELLAQQPRGMSEHELLQRLRSDEYALFPPSALDDHLGLFQSHFLLFHALYRLRDRLLGGQRHLLQISALSIVLQDYREGEARLCEADPLRDYYLELNNLDQTDEADVVELLAAFWQRMQLGEPQRVAAALEVLELEQAVDFGQVQHQYRRLMMRHHPDRGGEATRVHALNEALAVMRAHFGS